MSDYSSEDSDDGNCGDGPGGGDDDVIEGSDDIERDELTLADLDW